MTPLCAVAIQDDTNVARYLIQVGARVHISDQQNNMPIHYTARNGNAVLTKLLIDAGKYLISCVCSCGYISLINGITCRYTTLLGTVMLY